MNPDGITYLQTATAYYNQGNLTLAEQSAVQALCLLAASPDPMKYLECLTLLQSIYSRTENLNYYHSLEPQLKKCIHSIYQDQGDYYYAIHQLDVADLNIRTHRLSQANEILEAAFDSLLHLGETESLVQFLYTYYTAVSCYIAENYNACIHYIQQACGLWTQLDASDMELESELVQGLYNFLLQPLNYMFPMEIYLANAYLKIGDTDATLRLLSPLRNDPELDYYKQALVDLTLAECYARRDEFSEADQLTTPYRTIPYENYPALAACVDSIEFCRQMASGKVSAQVPLRVGLAAQSQWLSPDILTVHRYNYALALAGSAHYEEALSLLQQIGKKGQALKLAILHQLNRVDEIPQQFEQASSYYLEEIQNILMYYDEINAYHSITAMELQTQLVLGASISFASSQKLYHFVLNSKGITFDADYFLKHQKHEEFTLLKDRILSQAKIQSLLADDEMLLEYTIVRTLETESYAVFAVTPSSIHPILLGSVVELDEMIHPFCTILTSSVEASESQELRELSTQLRRKLILPIRDLLNGIHRILIAPAGQLFELPFELLTLRPSQPLYETFQIRYLQLGRELIYRRSSTAAPMITPVVVSFGDPDYLQATPLPYSEQEVEAIHSIYGGLQFTKDEATCSNFIKTCSDADYLHLALHGTYDASAPGDHLSAFDAYGLIFAGDQFLSAHDILNLDLSQVQLCVLSACNSGLGKIHSNEGLYGLRRAFTLAGCRELIVSLWAIEDSSASLFMICFYQALHTGYNYLDALDFAKDQLRTTTLQEWNTKLFELGLEDLSHLYPNQSDSFIPYESPYYWAGYILT